ncbi:MAG: hypothetical protein ACLTBV_04340 [Enterocloster bolteae]
MKQEKKNDVAVLLDYAGSRRGLTFLGLALSALSMLFSMAPYICIWLTARNLIAAAPEWTQAQNISKYGWIAFAFAVERYYPVFCRSDVYPPSCFPHSFQHTKARSCSYNEGSAGFF